MRIEFVCRRDRELRTATKTEQIAASELGHIGQRLAAVWTGDFQMRIAARQGKKVPSPDAPLARPLLPPAYFVTELETGCVGLTDAGRPIPLFHFGAYVFPVEGKPLPFRPEFEGHLFLRMAEQAFLANTKQSVARLNRLSGPCTACNCHGRVFTEGKFLVQDAHVLAILDDNRYTAVDDARAGDIAVYFRANVATHSGFVRQEKAGGPVFIESKWGPFGVFVHAPRAHPFPGDVRFFRSPRHGHRLTIEPK